ncbi:MAG: 6,7-dimethyl-8-ribityllumazine synthase [Acidobacteriota bacterium]|nr:6,7-dimethyl-8-ribityllumazine synthase [Acidobacteriota bacterium]
MGSNLPRDVDLSARGLRIGVVAARFNEEIVNDLLADALDCLVELGATKPGLRVVRVPGAFEIPLAARWLAESDTVDAVVALGVIVKGETSHHDILGHEVVNALSRVAGETRVPVSLGVLTTETLEQARARSERGSAGNRGRHAARAAVEMAQLARRLRR